MSTKPSGESTSKASASHQKDAAAVGQVPSDKPSVQRIVNMMHGGTLASLGMDCCCCCGSSKSQPIERKLCTIVNKRGPYVKGKGIAEWCKEQEFRLGFKATNENIMLLTQYLVKYEFMLDAEKTSKEKKSIQPVKKKVLTTDMSVFKKEFYIWRYDGSPMMRKLLMGLIVGTVIFFCLMPAWPRFMKVGVWYCAVTLLLTIIGFSIIRFIIWLVVWICAGWHLTIFPYIFIDGIPIGEAFMPWGPAIPAWGSGGSWYQDEEDSMRYYRVGALVGTIAIAYWVYSQPTEFDDYMSATQSFTDDLYSGNLLSDMSNTAKENIDKPKYQSLADILFEEADNAAAADAAVAEEAVEEKTKTIPSLDDILNEVGDNEDKEDKDEEQQEAEDILNEILADEDAEEGTH